MFIVGMLVWWYGSGWRQRIVYLRERLSSTMDYFSIDLLLKTFFSPFRQISAGKVTGPLAVQMRALLDRLVSRVIGAMIRFFMIIVGVAVIIMQVVFGSVLLVVWAVIPVLPLLGLFGFLTGWVPWKL
jgi:hypothetical protein